jgi:hypothetical protein
MNMEERAVKRKEGERKDIERWKEGKRGREERGLERGGVG